MGQKTKRVQLAPPHRHHLVDENAERPPVDALVVARLAEELGGHVLGRAAQGVRFFTGRQTLGESKVRHLDVTLPVDEEILGLEVTVDVVRGLDVVS